MPRRILIALIVGLTLAVGAQPQAADPCALLTSDDISAVLGGPVNAPNSDSQTCVYTTQGTTWNGDNAQVTLMLAGGRADFDRGFSFAATSGMPDTPLSGIGDKAYENNQCGDQCSQVNVLKKGTYFLITVQEDPKHAKSAVTLARKVAARL
jgi:hypothetical protein